MSSGTAGHYKVGFSGEMPDAQPSTYGPTSYASALNKAAEAKQKGIVQPEKAPDRRRNRQPITNLKLPFPELQVVRQVDRSKATAEHRNFEADLRDAAAKLGLRALPLSEMKLVLITPKAFDDAMQTRYDYAARQSVDKPGLRNKAVRETAGHLQDYIADTTREHNQSLLEMTSGESLQVAARMADPDNVKWLQPLDGIDLSGEDATLLNSQDLLDKAYSLWQPTTAEVVDFAATGPSGYGVCFDDSLGVYRGEATAIGNGIARAVDFNPSHFRVRPNAEWRMTLVESGERMLSDVGELQLPDCPIDWPLGAPIALHEL